MQEETLLVTTPDGNGVHTWLWTGQVPPRAVVQIVHGMAEHAHRYARLAEALVAEGYAVIAHDLRGHGQTAHRQSDLGFFAESDGWKKVVADARAVTEEARSRFPEAPVVLMGHSMGSYIVQSYLFEHDDVAAAVFSASARNDGLLPSLARRISRFERWRLGARKPSWLVQRLSFGEFARGIPNRRTDFDWLSRDQAEVDAYIADPLSGFDVGVGIWEELTHAFKTLSDPAHVARVRSDLPLYAIAGGDDPAVDKGKGFEALRGLWEARLDDTTFKLYPGARHELFNEINRDEVTADLIAWLDAHLP